MFISGPTAAGGKGTRSGNGPLRNGLWCNGYVAAEVRSGRIVLDEDLQEKAGDGGAIIMGKGLHDSDRQAIRVLIYTLEAAS
jgi:hypothetical protein